MSGELEACAECSRMCPMMHQRNRDTSYSEPTLNREQNADEGGLPNVDHMDISIETGNKVMTSADLAGPANPEKGRKRTKVTKPKSKTAKAARVTAEDHSPVSFVSVGRRALDHFLQGVPLLADLDKALQVSEQASAQQARIAELEAAANRSLEEIDKLMASLAQEKASYSATIKRLEDKLDDQEGSLLDLQKSVDTLREGKEAADRANLLMKEELEEARADIEAERKKADDQLAFVNNAAERMLPIMFRRGVHTARKALKEKKVDYSALDEIEPDQATHTDDELEELK